MPSRLIPRLLVVFTRQLEILVTTLVDCSRELHLYSESSFLGSWLLVKGHCDFFVESLKAKPDVLRSVNVEDK